MHDAGYPPLNRLTPDQIEAERTYSEIFRLRDGRHVVIRPIQPADASQLADGLKYLSLQSNYYRFLSIRRSLSSTELEFLTHFDGENNYALVAATDQPYRDQQIGVGVARWVRLPKDPECAEFAIVIVDEFQKLGLGLRLMELLIEGARRHGVKRIVGTMHSGNTGIQKLLVRLGCTRYRTVGPETLQTEILLD